MDPSSGKKSAGEAAAPAALVLVAVAWYLSAYLRHPALPGTDPFHPEGWWGWWDQGKYLESAQAIANLDLQPEHHWYPWGYPLLGAPFLELAPGHAFLIPNLVCTMGILVLTTAIARRFLPHAEAVILAFLAVLAHPMVRDTLVVPWNTIPTHLLTYATIALLALDRPSLRSFGAAGALAGLIFACRPGDGVFLVPMFACAALERRDPMFVVRAAAWSLGGALPLVAGAAALNTWVFGGPLDNPYYELTRQVGFDWAPAATKAWSLLVDGRPIYWEQAPMLLARAPWIALCVPGAAFAVKEYGIRFAGVPLSMASCWLFYLGYNDFDPNSVFQYNLVHYLSWTVPLLGLFAWLSFRRAFQALSWPVWATAMVVPVLLAALVDLRAVPIDWTAAAARSGGAEAPAVRLDDGSFGTRIKLSGRGSNRDALAVATLDPIKFDSLLLAGWPDDKDAWPLLRVDDRDVEPKEYRPIFGPQGLRIAFHRRQTASRLRISVNPEFQARPVAISEISFERLEWRFGARVAALVHPAPEPPPDLGPRAWYVGTVADHRSMNGECTGPDGVSDQGVRVRLPPSGVATLEIETEEPAARWAACIDPIGDGGEFVVHVPDDRGFASGASVWVRGLDPLGKEVFVLPVAHRARTWRADALMLTGCVSRLEGRLNGRDCPSEVVVYGPYAEAPPGGLITARYRLEGEQGDVDVRVDITSDGGNRTHAAAFGKLSAGETLELDVAAEAGVTPLTFEGRLFVDPSPGAVFDVTMAEVAIAHPSK